MQEIQIVVLRGGQWVVVVMTVELAAGLVGGAVMRVPNRACVAVILCVRSHDLSLSFLI